MIDVSELVEAIQGSVITAANALAEQNRDILLQYFEIGPSHTDPKELVEQAKKQADAANSGDSDGSHAAELSGSLRALADSLNASSKSLQPKMVALDFPTAKDGEPAIHTVHVPLVALAPHVGTAIQQLKFSADLEARVDDEGRVQVGFAPVRSPVKSAQSGLQGDQATSYSGRPPAVSHSPVHLEIVVEGTPVTDGLKKIVEGYERTLRSQIPG